MGLIIFILRYTLLIFLYLFLFHTVRLIYKSLKAETGLRPAVRAELVDLGKKGAEAGEHSLLGENNILTGYAHIYLFEGKYWIQKIGGTRYPLLNGRTVIDAAALSPGDTIETGAAILQFREVETCGQKSSQMLGW